MSPLEALAGFLSELSAAEARVADLERAMAAQVVCEGRVAAVTAREHKRALAKLVRLERRLQCR